MKTVELFDFDKAYRPRLIAGCDEAGRGPLAGPVVCASCIMPYDRMVDKINDSKQVAEPVRETLYSLITECAVDWRVAVIEREVIDDINILNATKLGMKKAIEALAVKPDLVLVDAVTKLDIPYPYESIIKGDAKSYCIAAASILAKVTRDRMMREYDKQYPEYGFSHNKGYGTKVHIDAIREYGECPLHRQTFLKNFKDGGYEQQD